MKKLLVVAAACALVTACGETQETATAPAKENSGYTINSTDLAGHIETLASDEFGGRAPGTKGEELTVAYLTKAFTEAGLTPANGDSYTQDVPLVSIETNGAPTLTIKGANGSVELAYRNDMVVWTRREQTETSLDASDLVFVGYGVNAPERNWNDYEGIDVTGKTVVMMINDPGYATQDDALFNGNAMTYYGRWDYKFDEAARQGAVGAIMIHETKPAAYPWNTVDASWTGPQFDTIREDAGASLSQAESWITTDAADKLFALAGLDRAALQKAAEVPGFKAVPMNLKASTSFKSSVSKVNSRNVAGMVKGSEFPDEYFIYMAHWDHIGTDPSQEGDGIYNGALDNATGTAGLIELAKAYGKGEAPKRSVLFIAVTAEEQGLLGSAYYAANPLVPLAQTVGGINMDGLNNFGPTKDITVTGFGNSELDNYLRQIASTQGRVLAPDAYPEKGGFYRSDHFELSKEGVPMLYPNSGNEHKTKGRAFVDEVRKEYLKNRYHKPADEYDPNWDLSGAVEDLMLYEQTGRLILNSRDWPKWSEGSEFKAKRDAQRAGK